MMKKRLPYLILCAFVFILVTPVLFNGTLLYLGTPDIQYVIGKVLWVMEGELIADPITGIPTFHPPVYHFLLSLPARMGIDIESILLFISMLNVGLLCLTVFLVAGRIADQKTALITALLTPFTIQYMGYGYIFLATAFNFSVPIYLLGLWQYLKPKAARKNLIVGSVLWGIAFIISPVYLFLIGFTLLYELFFRRDLKRFAYLTGPFLVILIPFYIQAIVVYKSGMTDSTTFAFWRGLPDGEWIKAFLLCTISPVVNEISWWVLFAAGVLIIGLYALLRTRPIPAFPIIAAAAYLFTAYHYSHQYSTRIYFFMSLFLVVYTVQFLRTIIRSKAAGIAVIAVLFGIGVYSHFYVTHRLYLTQNDKIPGYRMVRASLAASLGGLVKAGDGVLATEETYRFFILPAFPLRGLIAYKSGEYFQLSKSAADKMLADYDRVINSSDIRTVNHICETYNISTCVIRPTAESDLPGYKAIARNWTLVFQDRNYRIFQRQGAFTIPAI